MLEKDNKLLYQKLTEKANEQNRKEKEWLHRVKEFDKIRKECDSLLEEKEKEKERLEKEKKKNDIELMKALEQFNQTTKSLKSIKKR